MAAGAIKEPLVEGSGEKEVEGVRMARTCQAVWVLVGLVLASSLGALGATLHVPGSYATIQAAINAANPGDTILVAAGIYVENLNITKWVTISGVGTDLVILQPAVAGYGIGVSGAGSNVTIENITITAGNAIHFLVHVSGVSNFTIQNVKVVGAGKTVTPGGFPLGGVDLIGVTGAVIRNVEVKNVSRNGVALTNSTTVTLENISVHDTGVSTGWAGVAIYATMAGSFSATFAGTNTLANTPMGVYVMDSPGAIVNLTAPGGSVGFSGQSVAPLVKLGQGSTPNLEPTALGLGLVAKVYSPESPTPPYNTGVAFYATVAQALQAAVVDPTQAPYSVVFDLGLLRFVVGPGMQIQRALNASQNGDTVLVKAGTYVTQGLINKGVVLLGEPGAVIKAPGSQKYTIAESSSTFDPIIFAYGGTLVGSHVYGPGVISADVKDLTIDGQNEAPAAPVRFVGILFRNVNGTISGNTIGNLYDADGKGDGPQTFGILVYGDSEVDVLQNVVSGFSRGGIGIMGDMGPAPDPVANVSGNLVFGNGLETGTGWWAENGIQFGYGAGGFIVGNIVTDCQVNNPSWASTGIMLIYAAPGTVVAGNLVRRNDVGIAVVNTTEAVITGNTIFDSTYDGIRLGWPAAMAHVSGNVASRGLYGLTVYDASGNIIQQNDLIANEYGLWLDGDSHDNLIEYNRVHGNTSVGVVVAPYFAEPTGTVLRFNSISGNGFGVENTASETVAAALNWWGSATGPAHATNPGGTGDGVTDGVIFSPWLGTDPDGDPLSPGVQITGPMLIVVDDVGPAPTGGYLNTAITGANTLPFADTIEVRHGTYDASTPITGPVTIVSQAGSASNTFLTGNMTLGATGVLIGRMGQGFTIYGNLAVTSGTDASTIHINWNNLLGTVANGGTGTLDATYNWWGGAHPGTRTLGSVNYYPYLPAEVDDVLAFMATHGLDADAAIFLMERGGLLSEGFLILDLMARFGLSAGEAEALLDEYGFLALSHALNFATGYDDFVRLLMGYGATPAGGAGMFVDLGVVGGAGSYQDRTVDAVYGLGQPILVSFALTDFQGNPVTGIGAWVTLIQLHEDGRMTVWFWGAAQYNPETGLHELSIPTAELPIGYYNMNIGFRDGTKEELLIQIVAGE